VVGGSTASVAADRDTGEVERQCWGTIATFQRKDSS
jgi:hypothetical protein